MNVLVTGGLGVNGAFVLRDLLAKGVEPIVYDQRADFRLVSDIRGDIELVVGDINDLATLTRVFLERRVERVVHMAALIPPATETNALNGFPRQCAWIDPSAGSRADSRSAEGRLHQLEGRVWRRGSDQGASGL